MVDKFQIVFSGVEGSEPVRAEVRAWLSKLTALTEDAGVTAGNITIAATYQHHHGAGWRYQAALQMTTPGALPSGVTAIPPECPGNNPSDDIYVAIRNVFRCVRRALIAEQERRGGPRPVLVAEAPAAAPVPPPATPSLVVPASLEPSPAAAIDPVAVPV